MEKYTMKSYPPMPFMEEAFADIPEIPPQDVIASNYEVESHLGYPGTLALAIAIDLLAVLGMKYYQANYPDTVQTQRQNTIARLK